MRKFRYKFLLFLITVVFSCNAFAQNGKVKFNGIGRSYINTSNISGNVVNDDSITGRKVNTGVNILDLNFNIMPDKSNEIVATARVTNQFGGFWGNALTLTFRQLYIRGVIANAVRYRAGDIYIKNSPYTTCNSVQEDSYNESEIFHLYKDFVYYDNFHQKDYWHLQGADVDFGLTFKKYVKELLVDGYIARNNTASILVKPETLYEGAKITLNQSKYFDLTYHFANYFEMQATANTGTEYHNPVHTTDFNINFDNEKIKFKIFGEAGMSKVHIKRDSTFSDLTDNFIDAGGAVEFVPTGFTASVSFHQVGPDFRSAGAQSKRLDYGAVQQIYSQYTNAQINRPVSLFDITKDENIYATTITNILMQYNPVYGNVLPYGIATPNRQGGILKIDYDDPNKKFKLFAVANVLEEIRGQGTDALRNFTSIEIGMDININKAINYKKILKFTAGLTFESTYRTGDTISKINFQSDLFDAGLQWEFANKFDLLLGMKILNAYGNEFIPVRDDHNRITDFNAIKINCNELLSGGGLRYRFSEKTFLTLQYLNFDFTDNNINSNNYNINQFIILFSMKF